MPCVCGSKAHKRTTHRDCPLNKDRVSDSSVSESSSDSESEVEVVQELGKRKRSYAFLSTYPRLAKKIFQKEVTQDEVKGLIKDIVEPFVVNDNYPFVKNLCDCFIKFVHDKREEAQLEKFELSRKELADDLFADALADFSFDFAEDIADEIPLYEFDTNKSFGELIQLCYDTTKSDEFKNLVEEKVDESGAFLHALKKFRKYKSNEVIKKFLQKYSKRLYNRHMQNIQISISY